MENLRHMVLAAWGPGSVHVVTGCERRERKLSEQETGKETRKHRTEVDYDGVWSASGAPAEALESLRQEAEVLVQGKMDWYLRKKESKKWLSLWLRCAAIIFGIAGGLCPLVGGSVRGIELFRLGYVLLGVAGGLVLFDTLFGVSSSWMRYMAAAQRIERARDRFRLQWMALSNRSGGDVADRQDEMVARLERFVDDIHGIVEDETDAWIAEFQKGISRLERNIRDGRAT